MLPRKKLHVKDLQHIAAGVGQRFLEVLLGHIRELLVLRGLVVGEAQFFQLRWMVRVSPCSESR
jgi:hypothetical protein